MKNFKLLAALSCLGAALLFAPMSYGQQVVGAGSSALFPTMAIAAVSPDPITGTPAPCGNRIWTAGSAIASGKDNRGGIPLEGGNVWVAWDIDAAPTVVCAYLSVDSLVGQRLFYSQSGSGNATLELTAAATSTPGANRVSFITDTVLPGLPVAVFNIVNHAHFNVAFTDIRAEDGVFANTRAGCAPVPGDTSKQCMGYGLPIAPNPIKSSYSGASAQVVAYGISSPTATGTDPISGLSIPASITTSVGADPVVVIVNTSNAAAGHLGDSRVVNAPSHVLAAIYDGYLGGTASLAPSMLPSNAVLHVVEREPVSGTYNTFEWQNVRERDGSNGLSQEVGIPDPVPANQNCFVPGGFVPPAVVCQNPLNEPGSPAGFAFRTRAIGTGEMVNAISAATNPDSIGYAFWSLGTFGGKPNLRFLTLDGVDPLYSGYTVAAGGTNGLFPTCSGAFNLGTFACPPGTVLPNFANIINGGYRVWSVLRAITNTPAPAPVLGLIQAAQDQAHVNIPDFVPSVFCANAACSAKTVGVPVFRSHYAISGVTPNNGNNSSGAGCGAEAGGDMAGAIFTVQSDTEIYGVTGGGACPPAVPSFFLTYIQ